MKLDSSLKLRRNRGMSSSEWKNNLSHPWSSGRERSRRREIRNRLPLRKIYLIGRRGLRMRSDSKNLPIWPNLQKKSVFSSKLSRKL